MHTQITSQEAKDLVAEHDKLYTEMCKIIKMAARKGLHQVEVPHIDNYEVRSKLDADGFDVDCITDKPNRHRIWWGY